VNPAPCAWGAIIWCGIGRVVYGASIAELATKVGQIIITDADIAAKTTSSSPAACWRKSRRSFSSSARRHVLR
jgi:tRNA(Arg) A34 adenosine deaminase TadA